MLKLADEKKRKKKRKQKREVTEKKAGNPASRSRLNNERALVIARKIPIAMLVQANHDRRW